MPFSRIFPAESNLGLHTPNQDSSPSEPGMPWGKRAVTLLKVNLTASCSIQAQELAGGFWGVFLIHNRLESSLEPQDLWPAGLVWPT